MRRKIISILVLGVISTVAIASPKEGREGKLSFIPKIAIGTDTSSGVDVIDDTVFHGLNADILYGVSRNFEMGVNAGWSPYGIDVDDTTNVKSYDKTLKTFDLMGVMRYSFNQLDVVTPYITQKVDGY